MSEVQRFWSHEASNIRCVREADFDRVTAERDALQVLLTAADERRDYLEGLMQMFIDNSDDKDVVELCRHALKPAEGPSDEA